MRVLFSRLILISLLLIVSSVQAQDEAEATETPEPPVTITIWWPDTIAHVGDSELNPILLEQSDDFAEQFSNVIFEHRIKAVGVTGGIMSTLRTASEAATNVLPTLTLVRRQDLVFAQTSNYIHSLEGFPSAIQGDLNNALQLGQVDEGLFGIPYLLDIQHVVYRPTEDIDYDDWSFDAVLERDESFVFPAGRANGINDILLLQYIASGGTIAGTNELSINPEALTNIFNFYETATDAQLIDGFALNHTTPSSYLNDFINGTMNTGVFSSTRYLDFYADDDSLAIAPIPSETGDSIAFMNGWIWVMVTQDDEEQDLALDYLSWMMNAQRQSDFANSINTLPSREAALELGLANGVPADDYLDLIDNAIMPINDNEIGALGRSIQSNFASILTLESSAEDAVQAIITENE